MQKSTLIYVLAAALGCTQSARAASLSPPATKVSCTLGTTTESSTAASFDACLISGTSTVSANAMAAGALLPEAQFSASAAVSATSSMSSSLTYAVSAAGGDSASLATAGAPRSGFIQFTIDIENLHAGSAEGTLSDGVHTYLLQSTPGGCQLHACVDTATAPFNLGTSFEVSADASASASGNFAFDNFAADSGSAALTFSLFEADGTTPVALFAVPEPRTSGLLWTALLSCAIWRSVRSCSHQPTAERS